MEQDQNQERNRDQDQDQDQIRNQNLKWACSKVDLVLILAITHGIIEKIINPRVIRAKFADNWFLFDGSYRLYTDLDTAIANRKLWDLVLDFGPKIGIYALMTSDEYGQYKHKSRKRRV